MRIWKLHALGNHFVFVLHDDAVDHPKLAEELCRRDVSIGADGLLSVELGASPPVVRMWNPDGTPDFCGNGLCCAALLIRHVAGRDVTILNTPGATVSVRLDQADRCSARVTLRIRPPDFDPLTIPLETAHGTPLERAWRIQVDDRSFDVVPASNGNMHTAIFVDQLPTEADFARYSPLIETHPLFPHKTNVLWCSVEDNTLRVRIWERSVGETYSCGTGAAAIAAIGVHAGYDLPQTVAVAMRGGSAYVALEEDCVALTTRVTLVFEGRLISID